MGAPTKLTPAVHAKIVELVVQGDLTLAEIAAIVGIHRSTLQMWQNQHEKFFLDLEAARFRRDKKVEDALFARAVGYSHPEEKVFCQDGVVTRVVTEKQYPPDTRAAEVWLKNRRSEAWKDRTEVAHSGAVDNNIQVVVQLPHNNREQISSINGEQPRLISSTNDTTSSPETVDTDSPTDTD